MTFATSNVLVNEEYLLYDLNNIISAVGGSMGLFLSFSFLNCFMCTFDSLEKRCCGIDQSQAQSSSSNDVTVPRIEMISECPTQLENIEALPSQYSELS